MTKRISSLVRAEISSISSGSSNGGSSGGYYKYWGEWTAKLSTILNKHGLMMDYWPDEPHNDEGSGYIAIIDINKVGESEPLIYFTYYKMDSGNWEIINCLT